MNDSVEDGGDVIDDDDVVVVVVVGGSNDSGALGAAKSTFGRIVLKGAEGS